MDQKVDGGGRRRWGSRSRGEEGQDQGQLTADTVGSGWHLFAGDGGGDVRNDKRKRGRGDDFVCRGRNK
jgi:hypothetical protein